MANLAPYAVLALLPLAACNVNTTNPMAETVPTPMSGVPGITAQDQRFATQAAMGDMFEVRSSQLALQRARRPAVRAYAQRMADEHARTSQAMAGLAARKGITLPTELDPVLMQRMSVLNAADRTFDTEYLDSQITAHRDTAGVFRTEIGSGADPELKTAAQNTLPMVEQHLAAAQRLRSR